LTSQVGCLSRSRWRLAGIMLLFLGLVAIFGPAAMAGDWPRCQSGCTANDATITNIWLVVSSSCTPGEDTSAELWATFEVTRANGICCVVSVVDIYADNDKIEDDYTTSVGNLTSSGSYDRKIADIIWPCGSTLTLKDIYAQWVPKGGQPCSTCTGDCTDYLPSKCYYDAGPYEVVSPLVADFTYTEPCYCTNTEFTDATSGGTTSGGVEPYKYSWDFGDSSDASTDQNPSYHYDNPGTYTVTLTVTDSSTASNWPEGPPWPQEDDQSYDVTVWANPSAGITPDPANACTGETLQLHGNPSGGSGTYISHNWTGDTGPLSATDIENPIFNASTAGTYDLTYTVTDSNGCVGSDSITVTVIVCCNPVADFTAAPTSCCAPLTVQFTDQSTTTPGSIVAWDWDFGDGSSSTAQNPSHTYAAGTYTVTLTVTDEHGCTNAPPTAAFEATPLSCCAPLDVDFSDLSTAGDNPITGWDWDFGDGSSSTAQNPSHTYAAGTYTVTLTVTDEHGCTHHRDQLHHVLRLRN